MPDVPEEKSMTEEKKSIWSFIDLPAEVIDLVHVLYALAGIAFFLRNL